MSEVKALFPIGKSQWRKWRDEQKIAFNEARESGVSFPEAVDYANGLKLTEKKNIFDVLEDAVEAVSDVVEVATPVIAVVKTVKRTFKRKVK